VSETATVSLWGRRIGAVLLDEGSPTAVFEYDPAFAESGIEVAPLTMPLRRAPYAFPALAEETFHGLPGLLADSLPDRFGSAVLDAWLAQEGRGIESVSSIERLSYTGSRGMGALEFRPTLAPEAGPSREIEIGRLVELASQILAERDGFHTVLEGGQEERALLDIISVGTSAGGARAKAVIALDPVSGEIRSGQVDPGAGFEHWLLKFDGVEDRARLDESQGYGAVEFAYAQMAREAGVEMSECRLLEENGRRHFMTRRFDRPEGDKLHMQSLGAIAHLDFNQPGANSYEQAMQTIRQLGLPASAVEEQFRRMVFNVVARNQDDHVKNIAFLMDRQGNWALAPAFDVTYSYRPSGGPTAQHQMTIGGKRDGFALEDLERCAEVAALRRGRASSILDRVAQAVSHWPLHAHEAGVPDADIARIGRTHRLELRPG
jgi:serine/threonine-protein kinase HipA